MRARWCSDMPDSPLASPCLLPALPPLRLANREAVGRVEAPPTPEELQKAKRMAAVAKLLAKSDAELGIDAEYTRPGVQALLEEFQETVADLGEYAERAPKKWALG